ncbi:MAG TPA: PAS domain-containing sensor histidine kinase, partial [Verrucomicrobiae bacterium]|nr:PAS domain-containing sensor histidine kinase [Verrucomicrobiae bacterium]
FAPGNRLQLASYLTSTEPISPREELSLAAADGSACPVQLSLRSISASGVEGFSVIVTDLTERRQSENALRKISEELLQSNGQLKAFSYSVSHDMRAPLRTMQGFAKILLEDYGEQMAPEPKSYLEKIVASAERLSQLIRDVLAYSQLSESQRETTTFDLDRMVRDMVESYPNLREADIEIATTYAPVLGYEVALSQCLSNLLCNALKFVPKGVVPRVKVWTEQTNGQLRLWVQDNGIGIAPKDQKRIFDDFSRVHSAEVYEGSGLGLSMVKRAVEAMGGTVGVDSELGRGSRFWIKLQTA